MAKTQGRGSAEYMVVGVVVAMHCCSLLASAVTYTVGGSQGWTIGPNYTTWAAGQSYAIGDVLFFPYASGAHDVVEVDQADYDACSVTSAIATYTAGNTNVTLNTTGTHYFLCSFPGHCTAGMKLAVTVGAAATPAPAPATTPAPTSTPTFAPTPSTSTAPVPSPAILTTPPARPPTPSTSTAPVPSPASLATPPASAGSPPIAPVPSTASPVPSPASLATPPASGGSPSVAPVPSTASTTPPPSSSSPPSLPSSTTAPSPPPNPAASLPSSASLVAALLCLSAALLAL